jgi:hypothetical protein
MNENPALAEVGQKRLNGRVCYLATVRANGAPRVHPVTPIIGQGRLFIFMEPTSPKGKDIVRDGRYALHCGVEDKEGGGGEFYVWGTGRLIPDPATRALAAKASVYEPAERYILFELDVERARGTTYSDEGPVHVNWTGYE